MRTSEDLYNRIRWDGRFDPSRFVLGIESRSARGPREDGEPVRVAFADFVPGGDIPWHRVLYIEADAQIVWDRRAQLDRLDAIDAGRARGPRYLDLPFFEPRHALRWDGEEWSAIGLGTEWVYDWGGALQLTALAVQPNGFFVSGAYTNVMIGEATFNGVAWWNGTTFEPLGEGTNDLIEDLVIRPDGRSLFVGGPFLRAGANPSLGLALWEYEDAVGTEVEP